MTSLYVLKNHTPILVDDCGVWATWFESASRRVARTYVGDVCVSTVFLGLDHNFDEGGPPILFESMVFGGKYDNDQELIERYSTWDEAVEGHETMVRKLRVEAPLGTLAF